MDAAFHRSRLLGRINDLTGEQRELFAAGCLELLVPVLVRLKQRRADLGLDQVLRALNTMWVASETGTQDDYDWTSIEEEVSTHGPDDDDPMGLDERWYAVAFSGYVTMSAALTVYYAGYVEDAIAAADQVVGLVDHLEIGTDVAVLSAMEALDELAQLASHGTPEEIQAMATKRLESEWKALTRRSG